MGARNPISKSFSLPDGREITIETGKLATQADGSVVVRAGDTMLLATVVSSTETKPDQSFFPLSVDYQEKFAAGGRIPGNFFRRETKLSDYEVLICRLVDRAIRPLFADTYRFETQVNIQLISGDKETMPDALVALAASSAIAVSNIPWEGPISEVRVAKIGGEYIVNPMRSALSSATLDIIVAATMKDVTMVEGEANECSEKELIEAIKIGHEAIKVQIEAQLALAEMVGEKALVKREVPEALVNEEIENIVVEYCAEKIKSLATQATDKTFRKNKFKEIKTEMIEVLTNLKGEDYVVENAKFLDMYYDKYKKKLVRGVILDTGSRLDGRGNKDIRPIWCEVGYLPAAHGSAIFNRGETQALTTLTLGSKLDEAIYDTALVQSMEKFLLHYNFPGFSVGEVKPNRGPGRREVGHANLAARSIKKVMPDNPYTIRIVSDILESNGSSSMATVCAGSMALMDGGIQIKAPVAGIAMGMIAEAGKIAILSDILGDEDALGDMDFKVTGTVNGITGCQMDIKIDGLPYEQLEQALEQARVGRLHIIDCMAEAIAKPNAELKPHAPRIEEIHIDKSFIGAVIGPGGKIIQEMQATTGTVITIEEVDNKGIVKIASNNADSIKAAMDRIKQITFVPTVGDEYDAVIVTIQPYGAFVDFMGGKSGLVHISELSHERLNAVEDKFKEGDHIRVKLIGIEDRTGKLRLSAKALLPRPERK
ncbi:MAG: polyribonucleotide nucleotidyltransferase [Saprospiraceae bacterium]|nr:polyribonucleotide nucleotidyltransferase [Saprospiraceae bacterium]